MKCTDKEWKHCRVEKMGCNGCFYDDLNKNKIEQHIDEATITIDGNKEIPLFEFENPCEIKVRKNRSALQFNGDTYYTLYTETKFNRFQKFLWKYLLNINIYDVEE